MTACSSLSAVPTALVPLLCSDQSKPGSRATREAFSTKSVSPSECSTRPLAEVSSTMLWVLAICSNRVSITGAACWYRNLFSSTASLTAARLWVEKSGSSLADRP